MAQESRWVAFHVLHRTLHLTLYIRFVVLRTKASVCSHTICRQLTSELFTFSTHSLSAEVTEFQFFQTVSDSLLLSQSNCCVRHHPLPMPHERAVGSPELPVHRLLHFHRPVLQAALGAGLLDWAVLADMYRALHGLGEWVQEDAYGRFHNGFYNNKQQTPTLSIPVLLLLLRKNISWHTSDLMAFISRMVPYKWHISGQCRSAITAFCKQWGHRLANPM